MLISRQLTAKILDDAQRLKKESRELHHACRNTRSVALLLRNVAQEERKLYRVSDSTTRRRAIASVSVIQFNKLPRKKATPEQ
jgi:hypothetical protein